MLIFYVDESGSHGLKLEPDSTTLARGNSEWFLLAAVGVHDTARRRLAESLYAIRKKHFPETVDDWDVAEVKGRRIAQARQRIFSGSGPDETAAYTSLTTAEALHDLETDLAAIFARFRPTIFIVAIDKQRLIALKQNPTALGSAYAFLYRRVALLLDGIYPGEAGVFVADQQAEHEAFFDTGELIAFRTLMDKRGTRDAYYNAILDKPIWIDTRQSSWDREIIQLADLAAFELHQRVEGKPGSDILWRDIFPCLAVGETATDPSGEGIVIYPMPASWPSLVPS